MDSGTIYDPAAASPSHSAHSFTLVVECQLPAILERRQINAVECDAGAMQEGHRIESEPVCLYLALICDRVGKLVR